MEDRVDRSFGEHGGDDGPIRVVPDDQPGAIRDRRPMPGRQVVEHDDVVAGRQERFDRDRPDVASPAGHEDPRHPGNLSGAAVGR